MALYIIISIEEFGKVLNYERTILVKANKVREVFVNNNQIGYDFTKMETQETEWFIFEDTELNKKKVLFWAKECERNRYWAAHSFFFCRSYIDYFDKLEKKMKTKQVFLDASKFSFDELVSHNGSDVEPIELPAPPASPVPFPISDELEDINEDSNIDYTKPVV